MHEPRATLSPVGHRTPCSVEPKGAHHFRPQPAALAFGVSGVPADAAGSLMRFREFPNGAFISSLK